MKIILWDVDGTLADTAQLHKDKIFAIAANPLEENNISTSPLGIKITDADWDNELYGKADHLVYAWIKERTPNFPLKLNVFIEKCEEYFAKHASTIKPRPGAIEAFNAFDSKGYYQAAVSSGTRTGVNASLKNIGLLDKLKITIAEGDTSKGKPDPEPYNVAFSRLLEMMKKDGLPLS